VAVGRTGVAVQTASRALGVGGADGLSGEAVGEEAAQADVRTPRAPTMSIWQRIGFARASRSTALAFPPRFAPPMLRVRERTHHAGDRVLPPWLLIAFLGRRVRGRPDLGGLTGGSEHPGSVLSRTRNTNVEARTQRTQPPRGYSRHLAFVPCEPMNHLSRHSHESRVRRSWIETVLGIGLRAAGIVSLANVAFAEPIASNLESSSFSGH
jgi:hypothetical protein